MPAIPADVNPDVLVWAREQSGYAPEMVAKRLGVKAERFRAWESGERKPTVRQTQALAEYYHRPFGVFFLPQRPTIPPLAAEYRRLPGVRPGVESPEFRLAVRVMSKRREVALELNEETGVAIPEFSATARLSDGPSVVGRRLREVLASSPTRRSARKAASPSSTKPATSKGSRSSSTETASGRRRATSSSTSCSTSSRF